MVIAITELKLKSIWHLPMFLFHALRSGAQAQKAKGNRMFEVKNESWHTHRTLSVWESEKSLRQYVMSGAHLKAMKNTSKLARSATSTHWYSEYPPSWEEAVKTLRQKNSALA
ncbi:DUF3291 domain-containing protein [Sanyastnella coralliicola]|uniref:DUF3291 domain-containing protein n=1 Tax=Sanyastnella coralliicola TaxID=3069118 RepID=UPI0027B911FE|nr:DUF3291 domain-containing protein [Longitalea sp. SCSIO 12813]